MVGYMSAASTKITQSCRQSDAEIAVSLGYDGTRFLAPVFIGDTTTVIYQITSVLKCVVSFVRLKIEVWNQDGELVTVGKHILRWIGNA